MEAANTVRLSPLQIIREALKGSPRDYTDGPIGTAILALAIPMVLEMSMESVFSVADVFYVGKLGAFAVATVGLTESLMTVIYTMAFGLSIVLTAIVARRIGEKDGDAAAAAAIQGVLLGAALAVVLGVPGAALAPNLLRWMGASSEVIERGAGYARVMLGGNVVVLLLTLSNSIFRGAGDAAIAMRSLWVANGINLLLAPCLIFGLGPFPQLGVEGAAIATTICRGLGAAYSLAHLFGGKGRIEFARRHWRIDTRLMGLILKFSSAATFQVFAGMASWIFMARVVARFGNDATAGYTIGTRILLFALFPASGMANAAGTMVGQAMGAGKPERAEAAVWKAGLYNFCFLGAIATVLILFPRGILAFFTQEPRVADYGAHCLRTVACGLFFYAHGATILQSFNGAGDTWTPTLLNLVVFWLFEIPLAYALAFGMGWGPDGVFLAITLALSTLSMAGAFVFRQGKWKLRRV
jgi:putative MATE family efflux protein